jgi:hypothetical protein
MFVLSPQTCGARQVMNADHTMEYEHVLEAAQQRLDMNPQAMQVR